MARNRRFNEHEKQLLRDIVELHCAGGPLYVHDNMLVQDLDAVRKLAKEGMVEVGRTVLMIHTGARCVQRQVILSTKTARTTVKIWNAREAREIAEEEAGAAA